MPTLPFSPTPNRPSRVRCRGSRGAIGPGGTPAAPRPEHPAHVLPGVLLLSHQRAVPRLRIAVQFPQRADQSAPEWIHVDVAGQFKAVGSPLTQRMDL